MGRRGQAKKKQEVGALENPRLQLVLGPVCAHCRKDLKSGATTFQVEEEIGRKFCSESCVSHFFDPEIEFFESDYEQNRPKTDLSEKEMKQLEPLRWLTLNKPAEVWTKTTQNGDVVFTYIAKFRQKNQKKPLWCVCMCFLMKGRPSFLLFSIPTRSQALVNHYRVGKKVKLSAIQKLARPRLQTKPKKDKKSVKPASPSGAEASITEEQAKAFDASKAEGESQMQPPSDGLASPWTHEETFRALITRNRKPDDIPIEDFPNFFEKIEETLQQPTEAWSFELTAETTLPSATKMEGEEESDTSDLPDEPADVIEFHEKGNKKKTQKGSAIETETFLFTFIKEYENAEYGKHWYVVIAREMEEEEQIEILDAFPTRDPDMVDCFRKGEQQAGPTRGRNVSRLVH